eukprot:6932476-Alexandrium_andersonii.AAC.1
MPASTQAPRAQNYHRALTCYTHVFSLAPFSSFCGGGGALGRGGRVGGERGRAGGEVGGGGRGG